MLVRSTRFGSRQVPTAGWWINRLGSMHGDAPSCYLQVQRREKHGARINRYEKDGQIAWIVWFDRMVRECGVQVSRLQVIFLAQYEARQAAHSIHVALSNTGQNNFEYSGRASFFFLVADVDVV